MAVIKISVMSEKAFFFPNGKNTLYFSKKEKMAPAECTVDEKQLAPGLLKHLETFFANKIEVVEVGKK